jgi:hypothetical protein
VDKVNIFKDYDVFLPVIQNFEPASSIGHVYHFHFKSNKYLEFLNLDLLGFMESIDKFYNNIFHDVTNFISFYSCFDSNIIGIWSFISDVTFCQGAPKIVWSLSIDKGKDLDDNLICDDDLNVSYLGHDFKCSNFEHFTENFKVFEKLDNIPISLNGLSSHLYCNRVIGLKLLEGKHVVIKKTLLLLNKEEWAKKLAPNYPLIYRGFEDFLFRTLSKALGYDRQISCKEVSTSRLNPELKLSCKSNKNSRLLSAIWCVHKGIKYLKWYSGNEPLIVYSVLVENYRVLNQDANCISNDLNDLLNYDQEDINLSKAFVTRASSKNRQTAYNIHSNFNRELKNTITLINNSKISLTEELIGDIEKNDMINSLDNMNKIKMSNNNGIGLISEAEIKNQIDAGMEIEPGKFLLTDDVVSLPVKILPLSKIKKVTMKTDPKIKNNIKSMDYIKSQIEEKKDLVNKRIAELLKIISKPIDKLVAIKSKNKGGNYEANFTKNKEAARAKLLAAVEEKKVLNIDTKSENFFENLKKKSNDPIIKGIIDSHNIKIYKNNRVFKKYGDLITKDMRIKETVIEKDDKSNIKHIKLVSNIRIENKSVNLIKVSNVERTMTTQEVVTVIEPKEIIMKNITPLGKYKMGKEMKKWKKIEENFKSKKSFLKKMESGEINYNQSHAEDCKSAIEKIDRKKIQHENKCETILENYSDKVKVTANTEVEKVLYHENSFMTVKYNIVKSDPLERYSTYYSKKDIGVKIVENDGAIRKYKQFKEKHVNRGKYLCDNFVKKRIKSQQTKYGIDVLYFIEHFHKYNVDKIVYKIDCFLKCKERNMISSMVNNFSGLLYNLI